MKFRVTKGERKAVVAVIGFASSLVSMGVLHGSVEHVVTAAIAALAAVGVYAVPNATPATEGGV